MPSRLKSNRAPFSRKSTTSSPPSSTTNKTTTSTAGNSPNPPKYSQRSSSQPFANSKSTTLSKVPHLLCRFRLLHQVQLLSSGQPHLQAAQAALDHGLEGEGRGGSRGKVFKNVNQVYRTDFQCRPQRVRPYRGPAADAGPPLDVFQPQRKTLQGRGGRMQVPLNTLPHSNSKPYYLTKNIIIHHGRVGFVLG